MEFQWLEKRRLAKAKTEIRTAAQRLSAEIIDHLVENGNAELRFPVGSPPRKVDPGLYLRLIADRSDMILSSRAPRFSRRMVYDDDASHQASTHKQDIGQWEWERTIKPEGLTMVMVPAAAAEDLAA